MQAVLREDPGQLLGSVQAPWAWLGGLLPAFVGQRSILWWRTLRRPLPALAAAAPSWLRSGQPLARLVGFVDIPGCCLVMLCILDPSLALRLVWVSWGCKQGMVEEESWMCCLCHSGSKAPSATVLLCIVQQVCGCSTDATVWPGSSRVLAWAPAMLSLIIGASRVT